MKAQCATALLLAALAAPHVNAARVMATEGASLAAHMHQPELIAKKLATVEDDWLAQGKLYVQCKAKGSDEKLCNKVHTLFDRSCLAIGGAFIKGQGGDAQGLVSFMDAACGNMQSDKAHNDLCKMFKKDLVMGAQKSSDNGEQLACNHLWAELVHQFQDAADADAAKAAATTPPPAATTPATVLAAKGSTKETQQAEGSDSQDSEESDEDSSEDDQASQQQQSGEQQQSGDQQQSGEQQQSGDQQQAAATEEQQTSDEQQGSQEQQSSQEQQQSSDAKSNQESSDSEEDNSQDEDEDDDSSSDGDNVTVNVTNVSSNASTVKAAQPVNLVASANASKVLVNASTGNASKAHAALSTNASAVRRAHHRHFNHTHRNHSLLNHTKMNLSRMMDMDKKMLALWKAEKAKKKAEKLAEQKKAVVNHTKVLEDSETRRKKAEQRADEAQKKLEKALELEKHIHEVSIKRKKQRAIKEAEERKRWAAEDRERRKRIKEGKRVTFEGMAGWKPAEATHNQKKA